MKIKIQHSDDHLIWLDAQIGDFIDYYDMATKVFDVQNLRGTRLQAYNEWWNTRRAGLLPSIIIEPYNIVT